MPPARSVTHRVGVVPQIADRDHPAIAHLRGQDGVIVLPPGSMARADRYENVLITSEGKAA